MGDCSQRRHRLAPRHTQETQRGHGHRRFAYHMSGTAMTTPGFAFSSKSPAGVTQHGNPLHTTATAVGTRVRNWDAVRALPIVRVGSKMPRTRLSLMNPPAALMRVLSDATEQLHACRQCNASHHTSRH